MTDFVCRHDRTSDSPQRPSSSESCSLSYVATLSRQYALCMTDRRVQEIAKRVTFSLPQAPLSRCRVKYILLANHLLACRPSLRT
jgi:hypothetical protein